SRLEGHYQGMTDRKDTYGQAAVTGQREKRKSSQRFPLFLFVNKFEYRSLINIITNETET
ncbi:hypothetical protein EI533_39070, partial [Pseudomonas donghuensis]|nr:hypothetical protein [Pseudomonas donghuensis]